MKKLILSLIMVIALMGVGIAKVALDTPKVVTMSDVQIEYCITYDSGTQYITAQATWLDSTGNVTSTSKSTRILVSSLTVGEQKQVETSTILIEKAIKDVLNIEGTVN